MKTKINKANHTNRINIVTLGCSKNQVDSEVLAGQLQGNNIAVQHEKDEDANIVVVNTCGFIDLAKEESINTILSYAAAKSAGQIEKLYVTGCLSHRYKNDLEQEIPEVDAYFGTVELPLLLEELGADYRHELIGDRPSLTTPDHYAYLKISEGCSRTCSFCAIPLMRGKHRSKPIENVVQEAQNLAKRGVKEIMLIAQELTYYGLDLYKERSLPKLLQALDKVEGIEWIRLHYAYPSKFPLEIIEVMRDSEKICHYLDMPLQHHSDPVLKRMRRQITGAETVELINNIRTILPDIALRTTMLVGFPGETDKDVEALANFMRQARFDRLGVFEYSHEEGTSGYELEDDVPPEVKSERNAYLMEVQQEISEEINQAKVGKTFKVLFDRKQENHFVGRTEFDSPEVDNEVLVDATENYVRMGDFSQVEIVEAEAFDLYGVVK